MLQSWQKPNLATTQSIPEQSTEFVKMPCSDFYLVVSVVWKIKDLIAQRIYRVLCLNSSPLLLGARVTRKWEYDRLTGRNFVRPRNFKRPPGNSQDPTYFKHVSLLKTHFQPKSQISKYLKLRSPKIKEIFSSETASTLVSTNDYYPKYKSLLFF